jgi:hypothetical protein
MALAAGLATSAWAQPRTLRSVTEFRVKADRVGDFQADIKEFNSILKKGGSENAYTVWASATGPLVYLRVQHYASWSELDTPQEPKMKEQAADLSRIGARILACTESSNRIIEQILPDMSLPSAAEPPKMLRVLRIHVKADKFSDFLALQKNEVLPAIKKSGLTTYSIARARLGASSADFTVVYGMDTWAEMGGKPALLKGMGDEAYRQFLSKTAALQEDSEANVYRFMPDLSYLPTAQ